MSQWAMVALSQMCSAITDGSHNPPRGIEDSEYPMLSSRDIQNDVIKPVGPRYLTKADFRRENSRTQLAVGDVLLTIVGTIGRSAVYMGEPANATLQRSVALLRPDPRWIESRFLMLTLQSLVTHLEAEAQGTAQKGFYLGQLRDLKISLPPLDEQKRIVAKLDGAARGIRQLSENLSLKQELLRDLRNAARSSVINRASDMLGVTLPEIAENWDSRRVPITKSDRVAGSTPYFGASGVVDMVDGYLFDDELLLISEDGANLLSRTSPIAFSISGRTWVNNHAHVLKFKSRATQDYVEMYLEGVSLDPFVTGAAQPKLTQAALNSITIEMPGSLAAQSLAVELYRELCVLVDEEYAAAALAVHELHKFWESMLEDALSGESP